MQLPFLKQTKKFYEDNFKGIDSAIIDGMSIGISSGKNKSQ